LFSLSVETLADSYFSLIWNWKFLHIHCCSITLENLTWHVVGAAKQEQVSETNQWSGNKVYDPARFEPSIPGQKEGVERLEQENGMLREELLHLEEDYRSLQTKRLQDVSTNTSLCTTEYRL
jgi:hypothetical protein